MASRPVISGGRPSLSASIKSAIWGGVIRDQSTVDGGKIGIGIVIRRVGWGGFHGVVFTADNEPAVSTFGEFQDRHGGTLCSHHLHLCAECWLCGGGG